MFGGSLAFNGAQCSALPPVGHLGAQVNFFQFLHVADQQQVELRIAGVEFLNNCHVFHRLGVCAPCPHQVKGAFFGVRLTKFERGFPVLVVSGSQNCGRLGFVWKGSV